MPIDHHHSPKVVGHDRADGGHHRPVERRRLVYCLWLTGGMMVAEWIGGWLVNSLALLSDAGHMLTHFFALGVSFLAIVVAGRPATERVSYGFYRVEILAALFNAVTLVAITVGIAVVAYGRLVNPQPVESLAMLVVACIGLAVNLATTFLLHSANRADLNIRGAYLHMMGDTISSIAVIVGALVMWKWHLFLVDPLLSVLICVLILIWSWRLVKDSVLVLMEATPKHIDPVLIKATLVNEVEGISDIHDVHVWAITSGLYALTAHIKVQDVQVSTTMHIRHEIERVLDARFDITHTILQFEC